MAARILISQPKPQADKSPYFDLAEKYNLDLVFRPFIKVDPMTKEDFRLQKVSILGHSAIVFTSRHAIDHFFNLAKDLRVAIKPDMKYFCKTEKISLYIQKYVQYRKRKMFFPESGLLDDLIPIMQKHKAENYFIPKSSANDGSFQEKLKEAGIKFDEAVMYYTLSNDFRPDEPLDYKALVFFSPEGIRSLTKNFPQYEQGEMAIACLGTKTVSAAEEAGLRVDMRITPELRSVPAILEDYIKKNKKQFA